MSHLKEAKDSRIDYSERLHELATQVLTAKKMPIGFLFVLQWSDTSFTIVQKKSFGFHFLAMAGTLLHLANQYAAGKDL